MLVHPVILTQAILDEPLFLEELVNRSGLSKPYVLSEVRRFHSWQTGASVRGRLSISFRVHQALHSLAMDVSHKQGAPYKWYTWKMDQSIAAVLNIKDSDVPDEVCLTGIH